MTTYYINPEATFNGDGSTYTDAASGGAAGAFNAVPALTANNSYLFKEGTITSPSAKLNGASNANILLGTYNASDGTTAGWTTRAKIDGVNIDDSAVIAYRGSGCTVQDLEIKGPARTGVISSLCIDLNTTSPNCVIDNCVLYGGNEPTPATDYTDGILHRGGWPVTVTDNEIYNVRIGFKSQFNGTPSASESRISGNNIHDLKVEDTDEWSNSDCIFMSRIDAAADDHNYKVIIENNTLSGYYENAIDMIATNVIIQNNTFGSPSQEAISTYTPMLFGAAAGYVSGVIIRYNLFTDISHPTLDQFVCNPRGSVGAKVYGNLFINCTSGGIYGGFEATEVGNEFYNNTIINNNSGSQDACIRQDTSGADLTVYNNIFSGLTSDGTTAVIYTNDSGQITYGYNVYDTSYSISEGTGTLIDSGGDQVADPLLDSAYKPTKDSTCREAGTYVGVKDYNGRPYHVPPTIGAYEFTHGFPAQTRNALTQARSTRNTSLIKRGKLTAFTKDAWDAHVYSASVIEAADGTYKMYYTGYVANGSTYGPCYATSTDLINWTKPNLGVVTYGGNENNNCVIIHDTHVMGDTIFAEGLYVMLVVTSSPAGSCLIYTSTDGVDWTSPGYVGKAWDTTGHGIYAEAKGILYAGGKYRIYYSQGHAAERRSIGYYEADSLAEMVAVNGGADQGLMDTFTSTDQDVQYYDCLPWQYSGATYASVPNYNKTTEVLGPLNLYRSSDNGVTWTLVGEMLDNGTSGAWDDEMIANARPILANRKWHLIYAGNSEGHDVPFTGDLTFGRAIGDSFLP